jgi:hypothetical protein
MQRFLNLFIFTDAGCNFELYYDTQTYEYHTTCNVYIAKRVFYSLSQQKSPKKVNVYLSSLMMKIPDHVYVLG